VKLDDDDSNSAIGIINPRQEESVTVTDLRHPILDMCSLAADGAENYLVSLDITLPGDVVSNEGSLITIQRNEQVSGQLFCGYKIKLSFS